jgi:hypothetical protein
MRNRAQIDTEEVAGRNPNCAEKESEPQNQDGECDGFGVRKAAIVQREVGEHARFFVRAVRLDEGAFVDGMVDETALYRLVRVLV